MTHASDVFFARPDGSVLEKLQRDNPKLWVEPPRYSDYDRGESLQKLDELENAIVATGHPEDEGFLRAAAVTRAFTERAFDEFENGHQLKGAIDRVFAVSTRTVRGNESYASEVAPYIPLALPEFGSDSHIRQRMFAGLPPMVVDTYTQATDASRRGAIVLTPFFEDMLRDVPPSQFLEVTQRNINDMAVFSRDKLGASIMGLGAWLPKLTNLGTSISVEGLTTTTGHGGTVHLIAETTKQVMEDWKMSEDSVIGVLGGAGSIGNSSLHALKERIPNATLLTYDKHITALNNKIAESNGAFEGRESERAILEEADLIVTAVTTPISLTAIDPNKEIDLSGKVIIDDSQPGSFVRHEVEERGGTLLWVVGADASEDEFIRRDDGLDFGEEAGIWGEHAVWGCEAEAAVLAAEGDRGKGLAIRERVTPQHARIMGRLFLKHNVEVADYQSYGQPVIRPVIN